MGSLFSKQTHGYITTMFEKYDIFKKVYRESGAAEEKKEAKTFGNGKRSGKR